MKNRKKSITEIKKEIRKLNLDFSSQEKREKSNFKLSSLIGEINVHKNHMLFSKLKSKIKESEPNHFMLEALDALIIKLKSSKGRDGKKNKYPKKRDFRRFKY